MSKRKFDYLDFWDGYGILFDADKYTKQEAEDKYRQEMGLPPEKDLLVEEDWVVWIAKISKEDAYYYDLENWSGGFYKTCDKDSSYKRKFKCWRVLPL